MKQLFSALLAVLPFFLSITTTEAQQPPGQAIELTFVDHLKAGLTEQDVFVEKVPGSGLVFRVLPDEIDQYLDAPLYTTATLHEHNPFDAHQTGPYLKGTALGLTLREWRNASGTASCTCEGGWGTFEASFENLVPNALYTVWHFFMPAPPTKPYTGTLDLPIGERDGSQAAFVTDAKGNATMEIRFERCLQLGENQLMSGLAIAYHSDQKSYGSSAGPFGKASHIHLFAMLPNVKELAPGR